MKRINLLFIFVFLSLIAITLCSAQQTYKAGLNVDLKVQCINNGTYCSPTSLCNLTVLYSNSSLLVDNKKMTNKFSYHNYTLPGTSILGDYLCSATCCSGTICGTSNCDYSITPTGDNRGIGLFLILLICGFFLFAIDYFVETGYMTFLSGILFIVTGIYSMIYGVGNLAEFYTRAIALVSIGVGVIFMIGSAYDLVWGENNDEGGYDGGDSD